MRFRRYGDNQSTLKEWSKQLNVVNKGIYTLYPTEENTLGHWKDELNKNIGINTFRLAETPEKTLEHWKDKLNEIYNI